MFISATIPEFHAGEARDRRDNCAHRTPYGEIYCRRTHDVCTIPL